MKCVVLTYTECQNEPSKPERKLRDVTKKTALKVAAEIGAETGVFDSDDVLRIGDQPYYGDIAVTNGENRWVFFTKVKV